MWHNVWDHHICPCDPLSSLAPLLNLMFLSLINAYKVSITFYVGLLAMRLLSLTQLHTSCHIGTLPWELIMHNFQHLCD